MKVLVKRLNRGSVWITTCDHRVSHWCLMFRSRGGERREPFPRGKGSTAVRAVQLLASRGSDANHLLSVTSRNASQTGILHVFQRCATFCHSVFKQTGFHFSFSEACLSSDVTRRTPSHLTLFSQPTKRRDCLFPCNLKLFVSHSDNVPRGMERRTEDPEQRLIPPEISTG